MRRTLRPLAQLFLRLSVVTGIAASVVVLGPAGIACACSCAPAEPPEYLASADAVFVGVVTKVDVPWRPFVRSSADPVNVTVAVSTVYKGTVTEVTRLTTAVDGASCGYHFTEGRRYLIFTHVRTDGGDPAFTTSLCSGNRDLAVEPDPFVGGQPPLPTPPEERSWLPAAGAAAIALTVAAVIGGLVYRRRRASTSSSS